MPFKLGFSIAAIGAVVLASACGGAAPEQAASTPADPAPINDVRASYQAAYNAGDAAAVAALFTDDAISMPDHHSALEGKAAIQQYLEQIFSQYTATISITPADTEITGDVAHEHGSFSITVTPKAGGNTVTDGGKYIVILKRQSDGAWKIHHDIDNSNSPPPTPGQHD